MPKLKCYLVDHRCPGHIERPRSNCASCPSQSSSWKTHGRVQAKLCPHGLADAASIMSIAISPGGDPVGGVPGQRLHHGKADNPNDHRHHKGLNGARRNCSPKAICHG